jgi:hypothetical protein
LIMSVCFVSVASYYIVVIPAAFKQGESTFVEGSAAAGCYSSAVV